jgi:CMP-N-acetylneuraminic acid synthetase/sugar phosphate isomerase/epimerase
MKRIVALIPARAGSTRVKNKNIHQVKGIPLLALAVRQSLMCASIQDVYISTDSTLYAEIAANYGATVPFIRPAEFSGTFATDYDVFNHFLEWYLDRYQEPPELIVQVRPTSPLRDSETIERAIRFMIDHPEFDSLRSVSSPHQSPYKMWKMDEAHALTPVIHLEEEGFDSPTQNLPRTFAQDGVVDIVRPETLQIMGSMAGKKIAGLLDHPDPWDIDSAGDLRVIDGLLQDSNLMDLLPVDGALGGNLGITQGRLTQSDELQCFPRNGWEKEFELARQSGYTALELFRDQHFNPENPLWHPDGDIDQINQTSMLSGVGVRSICDDFVQQCSWAKLTAGQYSLLVDLLLKAAQINASLVVYPLFLKADITASGQRGSFIQYIKPLADVARKLNLKIALEITENAESLCALFQDIDRTNVGFCLDTGNLFAAGFSAVEILRDGRLQPHLFHVHLKDRDLEGKNVPPGEGCVDFDAIFAALFEHGYSGTLVTETARGVDPFETATANKKYFNLASIHGYRYKKVAE